MAFDDIPEDSAESHQCPYCEAGNVKMTDRFVWECDQCDFRADPFKDKEVE
jgi:ribosomal protein L37AE/L43A